jgi:hypothetical protein
LGRRRLAGGFFHGVPFSPDGSRRSPGHASGRYGRCTMRMNPSRGRSDRDRRSAVNYPPPGIPHTQPPVPPGGFFVASYVSRGTWDDGRLQGFTDLRVAADLPRPRHRGRRDRARRRALPELPSGRASRAAAPGHDGGGGRRRPRARPFAQSPEFIRARLAGCTVVGQSNSALGGPRSGGFT